jgi:glycosyltransferase involved in cell wall biosynthesis
MDLSVVLSFRNEASNLEEMVSRLIASLRNELNIKFELIFVNDASNDGSFEILKALQEGMAPEIVIVNMSRNFGVAECVLAGFEVSQGAKVVYMDCDLQDPPELIPALLKRASETGAEIVHTKRISRAGESWMKLRITSLGYRYLSRVYETTIPKEAGDFKLLSRRIVDLILDHKEHLPFIRGSIANLGFSQSFIEYSRNPRADGAKNTKFRVFSWRWLSGHIDRTLISFTDVPLKISLMVGFLVSLLSLLGIVVVVLMKIFNLSVGGWAAIMVSVFFLGGIQMIIVGIVGLYINVIYRETKARPIYIIDQVIRN